MLLPGRQGALLPLLGSFSDSSPSWYGTGDSVLLLGSAREQSGENVENYDPSGRRGALGVVLYHLFPVLHRLLG